MMVNDVLQRIDAAMLRDGVSQIALSKEIGIPQSTLSRSLNRAVRVTKTHRKICKFFRIPIDTEIGTLGTFGANALQQAMAEVWDGTDRHAAALARLLRVASQVSSTGAHASRRSS